MIVDNEIYYENMEKPVHMRIGHNVATLKYLSSVRPWPCS